MVPMGFHRASKSGRGSSAAAPTPVCIAVDWSGARAGVRSKLWLAEARDGALVRLESGRSREELIAHLGELASRSNDLVVGLDFSFSLPAWFLRARGLDSARALWELASLEGERWLATCPPPFWGKPGRRRPELGAGESPYRRTESVELARAGVGPKSTLQIGGAGSVGTGSLRGMPFLARLQDGGFAIAPFDRARLPLLVEIYPRDLTGQVTKSRRAARELVLARDFARLDPRLARAAAASEDAFDAAVSALVMARHARDFVRLAPASDAIERLEGRIWRPTRDPAEVLMRVQR